MGERRPPDAATAQILEHQDDLVIQVLQGLGGETPAPAALHGGHAGYDLPSRFLRAGRALENQGAYTVGNVLQFVGRQTFEKTPGLPLAPSGGACAQSTHQDCFHRHTPVRT